MISFKQREGKFNFKSLTEEKTVNLSNFFSKNNKLDETISYYANPKNNMHSEFPAIIYGKPNSILRELENSLGVWVFDFSNKVSILMFSDGFRKNNYRGTNYEIIMDENTKELDIAKALDCFSNNFQERFKDELKDEYEKMEKIFKKLKNI